ncbi:SRPBCC family protein [Thermodesulfobacteriota bacterium]
MATVINIHERGLDGTPEQVGMLIDSLASLKDNLWPCHSWPRMKFDRPLDVGAAGGHGPVRYFVEEYAPGRSIKFCFIGPKGFNGFHGYDMIRAEHRSVVLRHTLSMTTHGAALVSWPLLFRPLHDALIEDSFATAQASLGQPPEMQAWSSWVIFLRWAVSGGKAPPQVMPEGVAPGENNGIHT